MDILKIGMGELELFASIFIDYVQSILYVFP